MLENLKPIQILSAREQISATLRKEIFSKALQEGDELILETLANSLGVSVTPVREALLLLEREGLIEYKKNKRAVVLGITEKFITNHYEIRAILESAACEILSRTGADLSKIISTHQKAEKEIAKGIYHNYSDLNFSFHYEIWSATGNEKMTSLLSEMWNGLSVSIAMTEDEYAEVSIVEHREIVNSLTKGKGTLAKELMTKHLLRSRDSILTYYI